MDTVSEGEKTAEELVTLLREENAAQQTENAAQRELISRQELEHAAQQTENAAQRERISRLELELAQLPR